jgi:hypothetical protein
MQRKRNENRERRTLFKTSVCQQQNARGFADFKKMSN